MNKKGTIFNLRNSVMINFIISYILVFLIPLAIIFTTLYHTGMEVVEREIHEAKLTTVNQFKRSIDSEINKMKTIVSFLDNNVELNIILGMPEEDITPEYRLYITKVIKEVSIYQLTNDSIDCIYIYLNSSDRTITSRNSLNIFDIYEDFHKSKSEVLDFEQWYSILREYNKGKLITIPVNSSSGEYIVNNLYYIQSIPLLPLKSNEASVIFRFRQDFIKNAMNTELTSENTFLCMIDENNNMLLANKPVIPVDISYNMFKNNIGYITYNGHIISYVRSASSSAVYVSIIPEADILKDLYRIQKVSVLVFILCICLGGSLTYFFTVRNYNPVRKLLNITKHIYPDNIDKSDADEFSQIRLALLEALDEKVQYENQRKKEIQKRKKLKLLKVITDEKTSKSRILSMLRECNLSFDEEHEYFCVINVMLSDYSIEFFSNYSETDDITQPLWVCEDVYKEMFESKYNVLVITKESSLIILVNTSDDSIKQLNEMKKLILDSQRFMRDNYAVDSYAAVSNIHKGVESIKYGIKEAEEAIKYFELIGKGTIIMYGDFSELNYIERLRKFIIKEEKMLIGSMKAGDFESAKKTLNFIFKKYFFDDVNSPQLIRCRLFSLINNIVDTLATIEIPDVNKFIENLHPYSRILSCNNAYEMQKELNELLDKMGAFFTNNNENKDYELKRRIIKIVNENYTNPDLNVSFIADSLGKNIDYVSRVFKKTTLIGLLDYIHRTRISAAKKLLKDRKDLTVQQISAMVGYTNSDSFIRAFKRIEGMTPGRYRNMH